VDGTYISHAFTCPGTNRFAPEIRVQRSDRLRTYVVDDVVWEKYGWYHINFTTVTPTTCFYSLQRGMYVYGKRVTDLVFIFYHRGRVINNASDGESSSTAPRVRDIQYVLYLATTKNRILFYFIFLTDHMVFGTDVSPIVCAGSVAHT